MFVWVSRKVSKMVGDTGIRREKKVYRDTSLGTIIAYEQESCQRTLPGRPLSDPRLLNEAMGEIVQMPPDKLVSIYLHDTMFSD